jgi:hypothetical protein
VPHARWPSMRGRPTDGEVSLCPAVREHSLEALKYVELAAAGRWNGRAAPQ